MSESRAPGRRRVAVLFHESETLGAGLSVLRVADELRSRGWSLSGWFPGDGSLVAESETQLEVQGHHTKPIAFSLRAWRRPPGVRARLAATPGYLRSYKAWLRELGPELVHANSLLMLPEATIARRLGLPVVVQVHELPPPRLKRRVTLRWAGAIADVLVGVSTPVADMLRASAGRTPVVMVRNGVPWSTVPRTESEDFVVGSVGYVSRTKGTDVYLRAAEIALGSEPDLRFEHAGSARLWGDDEFDSLVDELASAAPLRSALTMLGRTSVPEALARWDVFVLASRQEAFPLSTLEAMAAGVPVVATAVGGVPEQITHLETGILVRPERPNEIADWILRLRADADLRARLGQAAQRHVREAFTLTAQADALHAAYQQALRRHGDGDGAGAAQLVGR